MNHDPFSFFLGLSADAEPLELLGLAPEEDSPVRIESALRERLGRLYQHPKGSSEEAELVRRRLREAAVYLKIPPPRKPWLVWRSKMAARTAAVTAKIREAERHSARATEPEGLTQFDRHVLAVLVGCGGWNAGSRARLVALAWTYAVAPEGLMTVITGLSSYARSHGPRLGLTDITAGAPRARAAPPAPAAAVHASVATLERLTPELRQGDVFSTIKLSALFAISTLLLGVLALRLLISAPQSQSPPPPAVATVEPGWSSVPPSASESPRSAGIIRAAGFPEVPTFLGNGVPSEAADAADRCPQILEVLDLTARKLSIDDDPSEAVFRDWAWAIEAVSIGWVLCDASTRRALDQGIDEVFLAATDTPSVADRLLSELSPPAGRLTEPLDLWRGAWKAGTLARISRSGRLPPAVVERARGQMEVALDMRPSADPQDFAAAGISWLEQSTAQMVQVLEYDESVYDDWELWISAQRELGVGRIADETLMNAVHAVLATNTDLSHPGPSVNVLGRLLSLADYRSSPRVRDRLLGFFADLNGISSHDLWVTSSLLATYDWAPWFDDELILPRDADELLRRRVRDLIARRWPDTAEQTGPALARQRPRIDGPLVSRWLGLCDRITETPIADDPAELMEQLLASCLLNEAAAGMIAERPDRAEEAMDRLQGPDAEAGPSGEGDVGAGVAGLKYYLNRTVYSSAGGGVRPGQAIGTDGVWAGEYQNLRRNTNAKLRQLRTLRSIAGSDLGPIDAAAFVGEVYHGTPEEVRSVAQAIAAEQFHTGPNLALELLDQFPTAPRSAAVSELIRRLTGRVLPGPQGEIWPVRARLALTEHVLSLQSGAHDPVDLMAEMLIEIVASRAALVRGEDTTSSLPTTPESAEETLAEAWRGRASLAASAASMAGDLSSLQRRESLRLRLADGPIQRFVAGQLTVLDLLTFVTVSERAEARGEADQINRRSCDARVDCRHVLEQAVVAERAINGIWRLRISAPVQIARIGDKDG